ncbi:unnamed protein product [Cuscuta campestris]|uniref:caffeoyl-CoA O-methyltransferase n=1 Tax=Cuscuta campestris TaxID=132261 RepID=A0A484K3Q5_9ASTE|nr:unnamed protein product [Cuscuta campestris]
MSIWLPAHIFKNHCFIFGPRIGLNSCRVHSLSNGFAGLFPIKRRASVTTAVPNHRIRAGKRETYTVVSDNVNYGGKQVISVTPQLYEYLLGNVREPEILRELREETATLRGSQMQVSPDQAQLLAMLVQIQGAQRCIEVGIFTGYSSLAVALVLPEQGCLVACERDEKSIEVTKRYYDRAGVSSKVDVRHGKAADTLHSMIHNGEGCSYDFAFIDADKKMYHEYFELLLRLVRVGGVIVVDNVLWHGRVADTLANDSTTVSIRSFNESLFKDKRVDISMVPIGDGMTICRKR